MSNTYSTQFKLLFTQIYHELCIVKPDVPKFKPILTKLNAHPIVQGSLQLDVEELYQLYLTMLEENDLDINDIGSGIEGKRPPEYATKICEIYYFERIRELKESIQENTTLFKEQVSLLGAVN